jgi:hypothetical protein
MRRLHCGCTTLKRCLAQQGRNVAYAAFQLIGGAHSGWPTCSFGHGRRAQRLATVTEPCGAAPSAGPGRAQPLVAHASQEKLPSSESKLKEMIRKVRRRRAGASRQLPLPLSAAPPTRADQPALLHACQGVPPTCRHWVWMETSGANKKKAAHAGRPQGARAAVRARLQKPCARVGSRAHG